MKGYIFFCVGVLIAVLAGAAAAAEDQVAATNKPPAAIKIKERKAEHRADRIIINARDKGSKEESDFEVEKEYRLMFSNNRKARKQKDQTPKKEIK